MYEVTRIQDEDERELRYVQTLVSSLWKRLPEIEWGEVDGDIWGIDLDLSDDSDLWGLDIDEPESESSRKSIHAAPLKRRLPKQLAVKLGIRETYDLLLLLDLREAEAVQEPMGPGWIFEWDGEQYETKDLRFHGFFRKTGVPLFLLVSAVKT